MADEDRGGTVEIAGLPIARLTTESLLDRIFRDLSVGRGGWLVTANLDFLQRAGADADARALYVQSDLIVADGAPLLWAARLMGEPLPERIAGSDLVYRIAERAAREDRSLYLLGGEGDSGPEAAAELKRLYPRLRLLGVSSPWLSSPPTPDELEPITRELRDLAPDLVYSAFGSPKQEHVIHALRPLLPGSWMMGCGISLSFISGDQARAPRWMQRAGLEWVHRMCSEPTRLGPRYLRNIPFGLKLLWESRATR